MTYESQLDLRGQVALLADAADPVARALHPWLIAAGADVVALRHDPSGPRAAAGPDTVAVAVDLTDPAAVTSALAWALRGVQRLDLAVITGRHDARARIALTALAAHQLGITHHLQPDHEPLLVHLARPAERAAERLEAVVDDPFAASVPVVVVDSWPDTVRTTTAAVTELVVAPRPPAGVTRYDPLRTRVRA